MIRLYVICHTLQYGVRNIITTLSVIYGVRKINVMLSVIREYGVRKFNVIIISRIRGVGNQHYVICHAREYMVWKINAMLSVLHGNTGCGKSTLCYLSYTGIHGVENQRYVICPTREYRVWQINMGRCLPYSPIARSVICGGSLVCIKKKSRTGGQIRYSVI